MPSLETIARRKEMELFGLLRKTEAGTVTTRDRRFLEKALEADKTEEMGQCQWQGLIESARSLLTTNFTFKLKRFVSGTLLTAAREPSRNS